MAGRSFEHFVCLIKCFINSVKHAADIHPDEFATPIESGEAPFIMLSVNFTRGKTSIGGTELPAALTAYNTVTKAPFHQISAFQLAFHYDKQLLKIR